VAQLVVTSRLAGPADRTRSGVRGQVGRHAEAKSIYLMTNEYYAGMAIKLKTFK
jgi:hypothetical protein